MTQAPTHQTASTVFSPQVFIEAALQNGVLKFGEFTLKSGRVSPYFFNAGLLATGELLSILAAGYADTLKQHADTQNLTIFGAAYKGIPLVAATAQTLWQAHGINADWGYNRKEAKDHGEGGTLVGADLHGRAVWVLDDVMTAGTAMREVMALLDNAGARVAGIIVALDRQEKGQGERSAMQELAEAFGVPVLALVSMTDIITYVKAHGTPEQLANMQAYRQQYGV